MRIPKLLAGIGLAALILSVVANYILYHKMERLRPQLRVNNQTFTKRDYHDWLEAHDGVAVQAAMTRYYLVKQAAEKAGMAPNPKEIDQDLVALEEQDPRRAWQFRVEPWTKDDMRRDIETSIALTNLASKDVKATDEDIKSFFAAAGSKYDTPTKLATRMITCQDGGSPGKGKEVADKVVDTLKQMLGRSKNDPKAILPDLGLLVQNYLPNADFYPVSSKLGGDGQMVLDKPYAAPSPNPLVNSIATMNPGEVKQIPAGPGKYVIVLMVEKTEGKRATLDDPAVRKQVERDFKATRATPAQEVLRGLWDAADIQTDPPGVKKNIEDALFPERINAPATRQASATP